ncbi:MAG: hypothetical protein MJY95_03855 [Bacteroidaceae bacterium]|nr:hypothetical protein [Bacteroidaceae bacterium]
MSKILSYNKKSNGEDWFDINRQYSKDEIDTISDPSAGLTSSPRTAIPSPFAQMDLVKNAFLRLSYSPILKGQKQDEKLVSQALDVAQLFFNYSEMRERLRVVEWNKVQAMEELKMNPEHRILGETLEMYLRQDAEAYNFDLMDRLFFIAYNSKIIGCTSPASLFMASPDADTLLTDSDGSDIEIPVEQGINLFTQWRPLYQRDFKFVKYIFALFTAFPLLKTRLEAVNKYLITNYLILNLSQQKEILEDIGNPQGINQADVEKARQFIDANYEMMEGGMEILGIPLYQSRTEDVMQEIAKSDFIIVPTHKLAEGELLPLVLQNNLNAPTTDPFKYITYKWDDSIKIRPEDYAVAPDQRTLPATSHQYPWLTDDDFFQPTLIKLDYPIDKDCFFDGNLAVCSTGLDNNHFLIPLKPLFFKYFDVKDLWGTIAGKPRFEMQYSKVGVSKAVKVILRIPVQKTGKFITLSRMYKAAMPASQSTAEAAPYLASPQVGESGDGAVTKYTFITLPFAIAIFPFARIEASNHYNIQMIDRALGEYENYNINLEFYKNTDGKAAAGKENPVDCKKRRERSLKSQKKVGSSYYSLDSDFDYTKVILSNELGAKVAEGIICPKWENEVQGADAFTFAVDFGTTNTHIEYMKGDDSPEPLRIESQSRSRLIATLYNGDNLLYDVIIKQEFAPKQVGLDYGFPQRTVLSECERVDAMSVDEVVSLGDANIPFIYEKESIGFGNRIIPNLKWSSESANSKRISCYLTEIAMLMRTKVLLEQGNLSQTRLVWFYPLSMESGKVSQLRQTWMKVFQKVFGIPAKEGINLIEMPESVAPYYFYKNSAQFKGSASTVASIDIGGGSSDVVIYQRESDSKLPSVVTSFRFAANTLFGDAFSEVPQGDHNPMLIKYVDYFRKLFNSDDDLYGELSGILDDIVSKKKSEDINAFLFSVAANKVTRGNDVFSYNLRLNQDGLRKIIFIYFYTTIIYYVAKLMMNKGLDMPRSIMFSGTGSKVLNIVGSHRELDSFTQIIVERIYGKEYDDNGFSVVIEEKEPKQITCRGALLQVNSEAGLKAINDINKCMDDFKTPLKSNYSMLESHPTITYADATDEKIMKAIVDEVKKYNEFFISLCEDIRVADRFLVAGEAWNLFKQEVGRDLEHHLIQGWNFTIKNQTILNENDPVADTLFFYPIIGSIRNNLIDNIKEKNL